MDFRIADTFTDSLARLTGDEQKAVKTTAFDLQMNPAAPGMQFHKLTKAKDKDFWSVRVNDGIRLIVHRTADSLLLCYVDHHDDAYRWAERRKIERHPKTGAAQLVEIRETVREIEIPKYVESQPLLKALAAKQPLFGGLSDDELLGYGVPPEWLADVHAATEDTLLDLTDHLPREASEALLELATGNKPMARFKQDKAAQKALAATVKLADMRSEDFDTVFYVGGHGPMWDLAESPVSIALLESFYDSGKPIALVCHSPGVLRHVMYQGEPRSLPMIGSRRTAIVTGASQGIGAGVVHALVGRDFNVVANSRAISRSTEVVASDHVALFDGDIGEPRTADAIAETAIARFGSIDALVNNAGVFFNKPFLEYTTDDFRSLVSTNLEGFLHVTQCSIKQMLAQKAGGSIITITAALASTPMRGVPATVPMITKGGLETATRHLAMEYARDGIRVNAVAPGVVYTPLHRDTPKSAMESLSPMGRPSTVQDVVDAVLYLIDAAGVTGDTLYVDGGAHIGRW